jgi:DNA-nicking Smr family endonuclease
MSRKRSVTDDERKLFEATYRETIPLAPAKLALDEPKTKSKTKSPKPSGVDGNTAERLRRGELNPQASLDLHGMTETVAHRALISFLRNAAARGLRLVIVVTGKGAKPSGPDEPFDMERETARRGVLKTMTPRWLREPDLVPLIADVRSAHRSHGGDGALYVYLRKNPR